MQKLILTISLLFSILTTVSFASSVKPSAAFGADIQQRCVQMTTSLTMPKGFTEQADFYGNIQQLESVLIPANNLLFESYLYANVSPDKSIITTAEQCQLTTSANIDNFIGSAQVSALLKKTNSLAKSALEKRVQDKYQRLNQQLSNKYYAKLKADGKAIAAEFRKGVSVKVTDTFVLPGECAEGLDKKYQKRYLKDGQMVAELKGSHYATFVKRLPEEACRKLAYSQYQGRHEKTNKDNLLALLSARNNSAKSLGYSNFAELSFQDTMIDNISDVDAFLSNIAKAQPATYAPWDYRYIPYAKTTDKKSSPTLTPVEAHQGLFTLLESEFGLTVVKLDEAAWHSSVAVYMLKEGSENIGKFYLDLYPRANKYTKNRHRAIKRGVTGVQAPSSALILNLPKKEWKQTHVKSFFHEFGHLIHNLVATQKYHIVAGISIESDLGEMPAKWFEWLSFDPKMQQRMFGKVVLAGEAPDSGTTFNLRLYRAGMALAYFSQDVTSKNIEQINAELALKYLGHPYAKGSSSQYSFSHLGTYGPRYYSYIWSEVVARRLLEDYFAGRFSGRDYLTSLFEQGGSIAMTEMFAKLYKKPLTLQDIIKWVSYEKTL
ncbi:M3 family metallopeptidase [Thalassotalea psychrophila]|uniref:M3 family metallopeptidase n=1 Tax=Thalassotalea psychrophila TaxID=3065647 RepID=A0ABY9TWB6_9GAMM|nr:M3 family metallopeptidase [Colwelliaceae bacterium SQ149]